MSDEAGCIRFLDFEDQKISQTIKPGDSASGPVVDFLLFESEVDFFIVFEPMKGRLCLIGQSFGFP